MSGDIVFQKKHTHAVGAWWTAGSVVMGGGVFRWVEAMRLGAAGGRKKGASGRTPRFSPHSGRGRQSLGEGHHLVL